MSFVLPCPIFLRIKRPLPIHYLYNRRASRATLSEGQDIRQYSSSAAILKYFVRPRIPSLRSCVLWRGHEGLDDWILRFHKVGVVVSQTEVRRPPSSLLELRERPSDFWFLRPKIDFFGRHAFCVTIPWCLNRRLSFPGCKRSKLWAILWCKNDHQSCFRSEDTTVRKLMRPIIDVLL